MIKIYPLNGKDDDYELYNKAYSWDKNNTCFIGKDSREFFGLFSQHFAMYKENEFIGYGTHNYEIHIKPNIQVILDYIGHPDDMTVEDTTVSEPNKITLAYIIKPEYRNLGYGKLLVDYLIKTAEKNTCYDFIEVSILKNNLASISLIEKFDFEFKSFDERKIIFQKQLKK